MNTRFLAFWLVFYALMSNAGIASTTESVSNRKQGHFIDAPVTGLYYRTSSNLTGITDKGAFQYHPGDVISFFLGQDERGYLLTTLSSQEILTSNMAATTSSRSINLIRLLLSLDSAPDERHEITLPEQVLSDTAFHEQLKQLDLNYLEKVKSHINFQWVSVEDAVQHLRESQHYIEQHFSSDDVIFNPRNVTFKNIIIKKKDWRGRVCAYDLRYQNHPRYRPPFGQTSFTITKDELIEHPSIGDHFQGCFLSIDRPITQETNTPLAKFSNWLSLAGCSISGCTRNDLNGFTLENFDDEGDWKYRSIALNFDPATKLLTKKVQGLGPSAHVKHNNRSEMIWFTYPDSVSSDIDYRGFWQETQYQPQGIIQKCLLMQYKRVLLLPKQVDACPTDPRLYKRDVTREYADMWWVNNASPKAELAQMNILVRWSPSPEQIKYTTWEYLPAGANWSQGILYRYQQSLRHNRDGSEAMDTHLISEYIKINEEQS